MSIDATFGAGFSNVDTLTWAFYREFRLDSSDYMKNPVPVIFFIAYGAKYRELKKDEHRRVKHSIYFYIGYPQA